MAARLGARGGKWNFFLPPAERKMKELFSFPLLTLKSRKGGLHFKCRKFKQPVKERKGEIYLSLRKAEPADLGKGELCPSITRKDNILLRRKSRRRLRDPAGALEKRASFLAWKA